MIPTKEQEQALIKAYKKVGGNAYFGNGFNAGVEFALEYIKTCNKPAVSNRREQLKAFYQFIDDRCAMGMLTKNVDEVIDEFESL